MSEDPVTDDSVEVGGEPFSPEPLVVPSVTEPLTIVDDESFQRFCDHLETVTAIAFDTEFVSEDCYRPDLCLIQVATCDGLAIIDPQPLQSVERFWQIITSGDHETIVHSGREELRFCLAATGRLPKRLLDVQLAAGLVGLEYPAAYRTLVSRLLKVDLAKEETRTNWRSRPLTSAQIAYALTDVDHLIPLRNALVKRLAKRERLGWCQSETEAWAKSVQRAEMVDPWRRVSGSGSLSAKGLAVVKELWQWREETARRRNCPARRVLRDDLIVELAKRSSHQVAKIRNIRGLDRGDLKRHLDDISERIRVVTSADKSTWPRPRASKPNGPSLNLLIQFLQTAMGCLCREQKIAPTIVGTSQDLRDYASYRLGIGPKVDETEITLLQGWRKDLVAEPLDRLLRGELTIGVENPRADQPLHLVGPELPAAGDEEE